MPTINYTFESDTPGSLPANVTLVRGGTTTAFDSASMGSRVLRQHGDAAQHDARLDLVASHNDLDLTCKLFTPDGNRRPGFLVFANDNMTTGYLVQWDDEADNRIEIYRRNAGSPYTHTLLANSASIPATTGFIWRVTAAVSGGTTTITVYSWNGSSFVQQLQTTDTSYTSGRLGVSQLSSAGSSALYDDIAATIPGTDSVTITAPAQYRVFQRSGSTADIPISGTYSGTPTSIEARFNGGAWTVIDAAPSGGTFSGTLSAQSQGQGAVEVRFSNDTGITDSRADIGIGDIFVIAGQSNASGRGTNNQAYSHATLKATLFRNSDAWANLTDPSDSNAGQIDSVSSDADAAGSPWPLLATQFMADQAVPCAFVPCAKGSTAISQWARNGADPDDPATLYGSMLRRITAVGGAIKAVLWHQGESDVNSQQSRAAHNAALDQLAADLGTDVGAGTKLVVAQIGYKTTGGLSGDTLRNALDAVRAAQRDGWLDNAGILAGPATYDIGPLADGVHFQANAELQALADRWWLALDQHFYGGSAGRGPQLVTATINAPKTEITLVFDQAVEPGTGLSADQFRVKDAGTPVTLAAVERIAADTVRLTLSAAATGAVTLSIGSGNDSAGDTVVESAAGLPAETALDESVGVSGSVAVTGAGTLAVLGAKQALSALLVTGGGSIALAGASLRQGLMTLSGGGAVTVSGQSEGAAGVVSISGGGAIALTGSTVRSGVLALAGGGTVTVSGLAASEFSARQIIRLTGILQR